MRRRTRDVDARTRDGCRQRWLIKERRWSMTENRVDQDGSDLTRRGMLKCRCLCFEAASPAEERARATNHGTKRQPASELGRRQRKSRLAVAREGSLSHPHSTQSPCSLNLSGPRYATAHPLLNALLRIPPADSFHSASRSLVLLSSSRPSLSAAPLSLPPLCAKVLDMPYRRPTLANIYSLIPSAQPTSSRTSTSASSRPTSLPPSRPLTPKVRSRSSPFPRLPLPPRRPTLPANSAHTRPRRLRLRVNLPRPVPPLRTGTTPISLLVKSIVH